MASMEELLIPINNYVRMSKINSLFVWLIAGADLFREKSTVGWLLVAGSF
jgi:hypothetical protein